MKLVGATPFSAENLKTPVRVYDIVPKLIINNIISASVCNA
jgi:hypothetical protein